MSKKIFLFSNDPGGANAIAPLFRPLIKKGYNVELYGKVYALLRYSKFDLSGRDINKEIPLIDKLSIEKFLETKEFDFIITSTSANDFTERYIWRAAKSLGIQSLEILDNWINYGVRFSEFDLSGLRKYNKDRRHKYLPSKIAVMDEYAKFSIVNDGIDPSLVIITGQPYFEFLMDKKKSIVDSKLSKKRFLLFEKEVDFVITFAPDGVLQAYKENDKSEHYLGYTDVTILREFLCALQKIRTDKKIGIIIRPHPKVSPDSYYDFLYLLKENQIDFIFDQKEDSYDLILISDLICGMFSMFLIESVILCKPILSIQIGLNQKNPFVLSKIGVLKSILNREDLISELKKIVVDNFLPKYNFDTIPTPIKNIVDFVRGCLVRN